MNMFSGKNVIVCDDKDIERLWSRVEIKGFLDCWEWVGCKLKGYGQIRVKRKSVLAHRLAYQSMFGKIPCGLFVCHSCDKPECCNPWHLFLGNQFDNMRDMTNKGRNKNVPKVKGEYHHNAILNDSKVKNIRKLYACSLSQGKIASIYGVSQVTIGNITRGKVWKHV